MKRHSKRTSVKYKPCEKCKFWITEQENYCPNCNEYNLKRISQYPLILSFIYWAVITILLLRAQWVNTLNIAIIVAIINGLIGGILLIAFGIIIERFYGIKNIWARKPTSCLTHDEQIINQRLKELTSREQPMRGIYQRAQQIRDVQQRQKIGNTLASAISALHAQRDQYQAKLWEIQLIRWHNALKPLLNSYNARTKKEYEYLYRELESIFKEGEKLLQVWKNDALAQTSEGKRNIIRLQEALASSDQMYQDLVAQQAVDAIKEVSRFEKISEAGYEKTSAIEQIDIFKTLPDVDAFSLGLSQLENEYFRLKSEEEIAQDIRL